MNKKIKWITQTAVSVALLIVIQLLTSSFANTLVTGSFVNLLLIVSVMVYGISTGIAVAVLSPIFAKLIGIGPLWSFIPWIILGNVILIIVWHYFGDKKGICFLGWILAAGAKFIVIYMGIVEFTIPILLKLPAKKAQVMSTAFSLPQFLTALIGGAVALIIVPVIKEATK